MSVLFAALIGGFALGQAAPNLQYFSTGKVAGARVIGMISRLGMPQPCPVSLLESVCPARLQHFPVA